MGTTYTVRRGDTLSGIARQYHITNWQTIYNDPQNAAFRRLRPNPNIIQPGDQVYVPTSGGGGGSAPGTSPTPPTPPRPTPAPTRIDYTVPGIFDVIAQPSSMTCWATVGTMMMGWRDQKCYEIQTAMNMAGSRWGEMFRRGDGLAAADHGAFASACGMRYAQLMCYDISGWVRMLRDWGPLAVVTANPYHARIMVGISGDGTPGGTQVTLIDPAGGRRYSQDFLVFNAAFEGVAASPRYQLWHY